MIVRTLIFAENMYYSYGCPLHTLAIYWQCNRNVSLLNWSEGVPIMSSLTSNWWMDTQHEWDAYTGIYRHTSQLICHIWDYSWITLLIVSWLTSHAVVECYNSQHVLVGMPFEITDASTNGSNLECNFTSNEGVHRGGKSYRSRLTVYTSQEMFNILHIASPPHLLSDWDIHRKSKKIFKN